MSHFLTLLKINIHRFVYAHYGGIAGFAQEWRVLWTIF